MQQSSDRGKPQRATRRGEATWVHGGRGSERRRRAARRRARRRRRGRAPSDDAAHVGAEEEEPSAPADADGLPRDDRRCYTAPLPPSSLRHAVDVIAVRRRRRAQHWRRAAVGGGGRVGGGGGSWALKGRARWQLSASDYYDLWALRSRTLGVDYAPPMDALKKGDVREELASSRGGDADRGLVGVQWRRGV